MSRVMGRLRLPSSYDESQHFSHGFFHPPFFRMHILLNPWLSLPYDDPIVVRIPSAEHEANDALDPRLWPMCDVSTGGGPSKIASLGIEGPQNDEIIVRIVSSGICRTGMLTLVTLANCACMR